MSRPRLFRTETVRPRSARILREAIDRLVGRPLERNPGGRVQRNQVHLRLHARPAASPAACASSGESFTPASSTYSNVMRLRLLQRKPLAGLDDVRDAVLPVERHELAALRVGRRVQRDRQVRHDRLARQPLERRQQADGRERDPPRRQREPVLVGQDPQRLHRLVVVVQRLAHPHQDDVEGACRAGRAHRPARGPGRRFRPRSDCGPAPSCRSGRTRRPSRSRPAWRCRRSSPACRG